ncbi:hypothetical protein PENSTE_c002G00430 [Penicillium steckii]|uniref:Glutathione S-transferase n=1 Tax=Penicillium steckii TaxID=303698 RepID=A0A1V6TUE1_9EURO|nr:hypothetical protein PENSTE_c002G00430 [Penicillium steckii]
MIASSSVYQFLVERVIHETPVLSSLQFEIHRTQPITLYSHEIGPNPWKVAIILSALELEYKTIFVSFEEVKQYPFVDINPNGRLPAIIDPNQGVTLWESGAIIQYLIDTYDLSHKLSYDNIPDKYHTQQWLHFQMSGQGPYYGQLGWFKRQDEKQSIAIKRYSDEVRRVTGVLNKVLEGCQWLVGDKCTYTDLSFVPGQEILSLLSTDLVTELASEFPNVKAWMTRMKKRADVRKVLEEKRQAMEQL